MKYNPDIHHRKSIRLLGHDYSSEGEYFMTLCTKDKECVFGEIIDEEMQLSVIGEIAKQCWVEIPKHFQNIELDEYVIMPNHVHGIIIINPIKHTQRRGEVTSPLRKPTLGNIVAYFKYQSTKNINMFTGTPGLNVWQRNYYEHIIRNEKDLDNTREYIYNNPIKWLFDEENQ
jgi:putative transposase